MDRPPPRPIKRLLVSNRGEIATRILSTANELGISTVAVYTEGDALHALQASAAVALPSAASYLDIDRLVRVAQEQGVDAVHPGYGFLSESPEFSKRMWEEAGIVVIGPGWTVLDSTGDKLMARKLAEECNVPVCPALSTPTNSVHDVRSFVSRTGYPIMIKAVDGGGGRGIRLVRSSDQLENMMTRAVQESPSRKVFCEKAAIDGFRHIEVQIIGDGLGHAVHLWERECSIQRRYQKIVELAPSTIPDRQLVTKVIESAVRMAQTINYFSLGTFEFLVNPVSKEFYFLEINPRLQVEHTITESICNLDIVDIQLGQSQGKSLADLGLSSPPKLPTLQSMQFRLTAENPESDWSLSIGQIKKPRFPSGNGMRVDTHLVPGYEATVSAEFDSVIAKLIVTASSWDAAIRKSHRALAETHIGGIKTNLAILRSIATSADFHAGSCDTTWLEAHAGNLIDNGRTISSALQDAKTSLATQTQTKESSGGGASSGEVTNQTLLFRKGDAWSISLLPPSSSSSASSTPAATPTHYLEVSRILRNEFPSSLSAEILVSSSSSSSPSASSTTPTPTPCTLHLTSTTASASSTLSRHRRGSPSDPSHIICPFAGRLVEILVDEGDTLKPGDVVAVIRQMKMELEVRSPVAGKVGWVLDVEDEAEEDLAEGTLICEVQVDGAQAGVEGGGGGHERTNDNKKKVVSRL